MGNPYAALSRIKIIVFFFLIGCFAYAQNISRLPNNLEIENFTLPGYASNGALKWLIKGRFARFKGDMIFLRQKSLVPKHNTQAMNKPGIEASFFDEDAHCYTLSSPECDFNTTTRHGYSKESILLTSDNITISGKEYDVWVNDQRVVIHSNVRIKIRNINELRQTSLTEK